MSDLFYLKEIAPIVRGVFIGCDSGKTISDVQIDSRECSGKSLFVPLPGSHTDGHRFIAEVLIKGAVSLVAEAYWEQEKQTLLGCGALEHTGLIVVEDCLRALHLLARSHREHCSDTLFIGLTGSSGKTTTKELLSSILSYHGKTCKSFGNLNSDIGLPLALLKMEKGARYGVFEMGMNRPGEMSLLAETLKPDIALITNIGTAHIGIVGSRDRIAAEKKAVFSFFTEDSAAFIWEDDDYTAFLSDGLPAPVFLFGPKSTPGFTGFENVGLQNLRLHMAGEDINLSLFGEFNVRNALGAVRVAQYLGVPMETIKRGLEAVNVLDGRGNIHHGNITVIDDCYNANPESVIESVKSFDQITWPGRKFAVLADMLELGQSGAAAHENVGKILSGTTINGFFFFGKEMKNAWVVLEKPAWKFWTDSIDSLKDNIISKTTKGDLVLLKGSRGMALERLLGIF